VWGTPQSSGAFSTLFESRILRALDYKERPFELRVVDNGKGKPINEKVFGLSSPIGVKPVNTFEAFKAGASVYLAAGDSGDTDIADEAVDLVVTDPPFFDNVHYSQLADFFHVWLRRLLPDEPAFAHASTRSSREVQQTDADLFANRLGGVFAECHRVLKPEGLLIFTYHHTRAEGWTSLHTAIRQGGFVVTKTHPVKAEMAVSVSVQQAHVPVSFDLIIVCRKASTDTIEEAVDGLDLDDAATEAQAAAEKLRTGGLSLTTGDAKVILLGCILERLGAIGDLSQEVAALQRFEGHIDRLALAMGR
jgi:adenine-specific DNA methylase